MKVPANPSADKLIMDYLTRVTEAGLRYLPKGARIAFVGRTRALIERECGRVGLADPGRVMEVLAGLGEPEELVRQERARIDAAWVKRRAKDQKTGEAAAAAVTAPRQLRPLTSRWKPATDTQPLPTPTRPAHSSGPSLDGPPLGGSSAAGSATSGSVTGPPAGAAAPSGAGSGGPGSRGPGSGDTGSGGPGSGGPGSGDTGSGGPGSGGPGSRGPGPRPAAPQPVTEVLPPAGPAGPALDRRQAFAQRAAKLARRHPLESMAVVLIGVGGLLFPILPPVWLLGALLALMSRLWDPRDKWAALIGPLLVVLAGSVVTMPFLGGSGNVIQLYSHALWVGLDYLLRLGCVTCAGYLAWRVHRGPRVKLPPWKR